ncbi:MAG: hypothetical protein JEY97_08720 [Bacteroidales bacterium]|nr:hypothetical protein [Bacteroidales bacterium]
MKKKMISFLIIALTCIYNVSFAQDTIVSKKVEFDVSGDLMSRYVWRGTQFGGSSPCIQPAVAVKIKNFEAGIWGSYSLGGVNPNQEFDFYLSYTFANDMFTAIFTDYFFPTEDTNYKYFDYKDTSTGHILEGSLMFNGTDKIPFSLLLAVNFYGADAIKLNDNPNSPDFNKRKGIQYSSYVELGYSTKINETELSAFAGLTLNSQKKANISTGFIGETGFYGKKAGFVNLGITGAKEIKISKNYSLPVSVSAIVNPMSEKVYLVFGISL